jgi:drug/metabolite transporter (DMT)-like permease
MTSQYTKDYLQLHFIVFLWGFTAILGMLVSMPSVELVFYRTFISAIALGVMLLVGKKSFAIGARDIVKTLATGVIIGVHWILFFAAARLSNISVCLAGIATISLWTSLLEPLMTKKRVKGFEVVLGMMAIVGIVIIFNVEFKYAWGLFVAIVSAFLAAVFTVINSQFTQRHYHFTVTFYEMIGATVSIALFFPIYGAFFSDGVQLGLQGYDLLWLIILALACTVYAYSESVKLMKRIPAFAVNLAVNLEPIYGIILALLIFGEQEKMKPGFYLGTLVILSSVLVYPWINRYYERKALETDVLR